jgi:Na+:H+ antiporter, NhaA family
MRIDQTRDQSGLLAMTRQFFQLEASGGILLVLAALLALIVANSPAYSFYSYILNDIKFNVGFSDAMGQGPFLQKSILLWINDGFMAIFFFLVGLEIKREVMRGELSSKDRALLPLFGAIGGMAVPALIYLFINQDNPENIRGWAIPAATDIAFALGVLALVGSRAPVSLKILLTAIAILDDLGAVIIIAVFYTASVQMTALYVAAVALLINILMNLRNVSRIAPYILVGFVCWVAMLKSGVHPTIAGVATALCIPLSCIRDPDRNPCESLIHYLHPWVAFMILPVFAFANAGVPFTGMTWQSFLNPITLGIAAGLFVGKQIGIMIPLFLAIKSGLCRMPTGANWLHIYGVTILCGIGFTMSLFIGKLAFDGLDQQAAIRLGVLTGSVLSALWAYIILRLANKCAQKDTD